MTHDISKVRQDVYQANTKVMLAQDELHRAEQHHRLCAARLRVCEVAEVVERAQEKRDNLQHQLEKSRENAHSALKSAEAISAQIEKLKNRLKKVEAARSSFAEEAATAQKALQIEQELLTEKQTEYEWAQQHLENLQKDVGDDAKPSLLTRLLMRLLPQR